MTNNRHRALTDAQWECLATLLPSNEGTRGRPWADHRRIIDAIIYRYRTGVPWRDLPVEFGSWKTVWARHRRWAGEGWWDHILAVLLAKADENGRIDWRIAVDSTINRAHQHATNTTRSEVCKRGLTPRVRMPTKSHQRMRSAVHAAA